MTNNTASTGSENRSALTFIMPGHVHEEELPVHQLRGGEFTPRQPRHRSSSAVTSEGPMTSLTTSMTSLTAMMTSQSSSLLMEATSPLHLEILDNEIKNLQV
jgi:hypothetical protein